MLLAVLAVLSQSEGGVNPVLASNNSTGIGVAAEAGPSIANIVSCDAIPGDINGDCAVSGRDLFEVLAHLGQVAGTGGSDTVGSLAPWDLNGDGAISGLDLFALLKHFGQVSA